MRRVDLESYERLLAEVRRYEVSVAELKRLIPHLDGKVRATFIERLRMDAVALQSMRQFL